MTPARRILAGFTAAAIAAAVALTPTTSRTPATAGATSAPDVGARHGHRIIR